MFLLLQFVQKRKKRCTLISSLSLRTLLLMLWTMWRPGGTWIGKFHSFLICGSWTSLWRKIWLSTHPRVVIKYCNRCGSSSRLTIFQLSARLQKTSIYKAAFLFFYSRCVSTQRALLESGTMGPKGHVQVKDQFNVCFPILLSIEDINQVGKAKWFQQLSQFSFQRFCWFTNYLIYRQM